jgi:transposase-like protein
LLRNKGNIKIMTQNQLETRVRLMRGNMDSVAVQAARLVLVEGMSQADAARQLGEKPNTVNNGVKRYKSADKEIRIAYSITATPSTTEADVNHNDNMVAIAINTAPI